jgi:hypothetical protein
VTKKVVSTLGSDIDKNALVGKVKRPNGRLGKQKQLRNLINDDKLGSNDRGWIKQDLNQINRKKRETIRVPIGKELAHRRGFESSKGYDYSHTVLQDKNLHKLQHKFDGMGKKNKNKGNINQSNDSVDIKNDK